MTSVHYWDCCCILKVFSALVWYNTWKDIGLDWTYTVHIALQNECRNKRWKYLIVEEENMGSGWCGAGVGPCQTSGSQGSALGEAAPGAECQSSATQHFTPVSICHIFLQSASVCPEIYPSGNKMIFCNLKPHITRHQNEVLFT